MKSNSSDIIVFSKDRPWQLGQLLRTIKKYTDFSRVHVLAKIKDEFRENYGIIFSSFKDIAIAHEEKDFKECFFGIYDSCGPCVTFMVDDVIFCDKFSSIDAVNFMRKNEVFSYQFKMIPSYTYCQTARKKQRKPYSLKKYGNHWMWKSKDGTWDWDYPFDLTGSIYFKEDLDFIMKEVRVSDIKNPNYLEMKGASICKLTDIAKNGKPFMACQGNKVCSCLAVNLVNPIKSSNWSSDEQVSIKKLNDEVFNRFDYDDDYTRKNYQLSVHTTNYKLKNKGS